MKRSETIGNKGHYLDGCAGAPFRFGSVAEGDFGRFLCCFVATGSFMGHHSFRGSILDDKTASLFSKQSASGFGYRLAHGDDRPGPLHSGIKVVPGRNEICSNFTFNVRSLWIERMSTFVTI